MFTGKSGKVIKMSLCKYFQSSQLKGFKNMGTPCFGVFVKMGTFEKNNHRIVAVNCNMRKNLMVFLIELSQKLFQSDYQFQIIKI
jgi:hypothetical protein